MTRSQLIALITAATVATGAVGCSSSTQQSASQFCQGHGGVNAATVESDGDATCNDGTEFDTDDGSSHKSKTSKKKRR